MGKAVNRKDQPLFVCKINSKFSYFLLLTLFQYQLGGYYVLL